MYRWGAVDSGYTQDGKKLVIIGKTAAFLLSKRGSIPSHFSCHNPNYLGFPSPSERVLKLQ
eukprot:scaffold4767_cov86-Cylindrotheca_fusiformis.AAC.1